MTCCINAPVHSLSIIPILPLGCFSIISAKAKASVRLGASGEIPQEKLALTLIELLFSLPDLNIDFLGLGLKTGFKNC